jgi:hypothetical protein
MTFEEAVEMMHPEIRLNEQKISIQLADGSKRRVTAQVRQQLGLYFYNEEWNVIHVPTELSIYSTPDYTEAQQFIEHLSRKRIDLNWGYRDLHVFKSILQMIGARKEHRQRYSVPALEQSQNGSSTTSA